MIGLMIGDSILNRQFHPQSSIKSINPQSSPSIRNPIPNPQSNPQSAIQSPIQSPIRSPIPQSAIQSPIRNPIPNPQSNPQSAVLNTIVNLQSAIVSAKLTIIALAKAEHIRADEPPLRVLASLREVPPQVRFVDWSKSEHHRADENQERGEGRRADQRTGHM
jgi:hypothetical protein